MKSSHCLSGPQRHLGAWAIGAVILTVSVLPFLRPPTRCEASAKIAAESWLSHGGDTVGPNRQRVGPPVDDVTRRLGQIEQRVSVHFDANDFAEERQGRAEYSAVLEKVFGPNDWRTVTQRLYHSSAERVCKLTADQQALIVKAREFSDRGVRLKSRRDYQAALSSFRGAQRLYKQVLGDDDVWSIATLTQIAQTEQRAANFKEMKTIWTDLEPRMKVLYGEKSPCYANAVQSLGIANLSLGSHEEAEGQLRRSLEIHQAAFGAESYEVTISHFYLADSYNQRSQFSKAEPEAKIAATVLARSLPEKYPEYVLALWQLAKSYRGQGKHTDAVATSARAIELIETFRRPPPDAIYADMLDDYVASLQKLNRSEEAADYAARVESLRAKQSREDVAQKTSALK